jgi:hypothetical protein
MVRTVGGGPVARFECIKRAAAESLDAVTYAWAARSALTLSKSDFDHRHDELSTTPTTTPVATPPNVNR